MKAGYRNLVWPLALRFHFCNLKFLNPERIDKYIGCYDWCLRLCDIAKEIVMEMEIKAIPLTTTANHISTSWKSGNNQAVIFSEIKNKQIVNANHANKWNIIVRHFLIIVC